MEKVIMIEVADLRIHRAYRKIYSEKSMQFDLLVDSIRSTGEILVPIVVNQKEEIISGVQRWLAYKELGKKTIPAVYLNKVAEAEEEFFIVSYNRFREKLITEKYREIELMKKYWGKKKGERTDLKANLSEVEKLPTRARIASVMNISEGNVQKIDAIARINPKMLGLIDTHEMSLNQAYQLVKGKSKPESSKSNNAEELAEIPVHKCSKCGSLIKNKKTK